MKEVMNATVWTALIFLALGLVLGYRIGVRSGTRRANADVVTRLIQVFQRRK